MRPEISAKYLICIGRGSRIRTCDLEYPKLPRYQTALYPAGAQMGDKRPMRTRVKSSVKIDTRFTGQQQCVVGPLQIFTYRPPAESRIYAPHNLRVLREFRARASATPKQPLANSPIRRVPRLGTGIKRLDG